jgi:hypothetical protein
MIETEQYGVVVEALDALEAHAAPALLATLRPSDLLGLLPTNWSDRAPILTAGWS